MLVETALSMTGPGAVLASRPTGVAHVYTGPLTPSGRFIPRAGRPVCRARTRRLGVVTIPSRWSSLSHPGVLPRLCARCSACLARRRHTLSRCGVAVSQARQAEPLTARGAYRTTYTDLTPFDLLLAVQAADTTTELDVAAHLTLVLFGHLGCTRPVTRPDGRQVTSLHRAVADRRSDGRSGGTDRRWPGPPPHHQQHPTEKAENPGRLRGKDRGSQTKGFSHMSNLDTLNARLDTLPPGADARFRCYLLGALAGEVDPATWAACLETAQACVDRYHAQAVAS